ncbi:triose-phosphate isomerase family protein [Marisediminicola senii]|uniref:triose-phosphate isomerase family protein n=1 Tax=Marisediminicola senii TaxID=2711233 RepID=UPI0013EBB9FF|nr:triose-phosphate isomerase family protein [Marisediminicola senii]
MSDAHPQHEQHRRPLYIGVSTKMYLGYQASLDWMTRIAGTVVDRRDDLAALDVVPFVIPSFPVLESARHILAPAGVRIGAQAVSWGEGALTGEVSAGILAEMGVELAEIGHAERRRHFGETEEVIRAKTGVSVAAGLRPLLCVGEETRGGPGAAVETVVGQVVNAVGGDAPALAASIVAYEPVWAIGAPEPADPAHVNAVIAGVRQRLLDHVTGSAAASIIYGGSAGPGLLAHLPEADGLFLGRFAHDPSNFGVVLDEALERRRGTR